VLAGLAITTFALDQAGFESRLTVPYGTVPRGWTGSSRAARASPPTRSPTC